MTIDWPALLSDIAYLLGDYAPDDASQRIPCGERPLARYLGVSRGTLRHWVSGGTPRYDDGCMMLERWCALSNKSDMFAPRHQRMLSAAKTR